MDSPQTGLTPEQIADEEELMRGLLPINLGAFFMAPLWGPAHGNFITLLFYPLWIWVDNVIFAAYSNPEVGTIALALIMSAIMVAVLLVYARISQPMAAHRAAARGKTKERYIRDERIWAIVSIILAVVIVAFATWYNLTIRVAG